jgi:hypothetical protein
MSSTNPPYPYYDGITYNPSYFTTVSPPLTQTQANALYLLKTTADTATGIETFSSGINTNKVDNLTTSGTLDIAPSSLTGTLNIATNNTRVGIINIATGTASSGVINLGTQYTTTNIYGTQYAQSLLTNSIDTFSGTTTIGQSIGTGNLNLANQIGSGSINIGAANSLRTGIIHIGDGNNLPSGANVHINNGTNNASSVQIMNGATTSGTCNILTGNTSSGVVNIATGTGSSTVNISTGATTGAVNIGSIANNVILNTPLNFNYAPSYITTSALGYTIASTGSVSSIVGTAIITIRTLTLTTGVWMIMSNCFFTSPGSYLALSISQTTNAIDNNCANIAVASNTLCAQCQRIVNTSVSGLGSWYLVASCPTNSNISNIVFTATRIG